MKKRKKKSEIDIEFQGYDPYNCQEQFFLYPMILEDYWWAMTGSEQKVLTYIIRKTFGWQKQRDYIALSQFTDGDGTGRGTGLSRSQVKRAIDSLEMKKLIKVTRTHRQPSLFELPLSEDAIKEFGEYPAIDGLYNQGTTKVIRNINRGYSKQYIKQVYEKKGQGY